MKKCSFPGKKKGSDLRSSCRFQIEGNGKETDKVVAVSLWLKSGGSYTEFLSVSMAFWVEVFPLIPEAKGWTVRIYADKFSEENIRTIIPAKLPEHMFVYWFLCPEGLTEDKKERKTTESHKGTFGSLLRFHALCDTKCRKVLVRNFEQYVSPEDLAWMDLRPAPNVNTMHAAPYFPDHQPILRNA